MKLFAHAAALAVVALPALAFADNGHVSFIEGKAFRTPKSGKDVELKKDSEVLEGDLVATSASGRLELVLPDKSIVRLGPSSKLKIDNATFQDEGRNFKARLMLGKIWSKVSSVFGKEKTFEVTTDRAVAGVRGTVFRLDTDTTKAVVVKVYAGAVAVAGSSLPMKMVDSAVAKPERKQIQGPQQVSKQQWEKLVGAMMKVKIAADGTPGEPEKFSEEEELKDAWAAWNKQRDEMP